MRVRGVYVAHLFEGRNGSDKNTNDPLIRSSYELGDHPSVEKLHFYSENTRLGQVGNFVHDVIVSTRSFEESELRLSLRVDEVDSPSESDTKHTISAQGCIEALSGFSVLFGPSALGLSLGGRVL